MSDPETLFKSWIAEHGGAVLKVARAPTFQLPTSPGGPTGPRGTVAPRGTAVPPTSLVTGAAAMDAWVEREMGGGEFPDQRLKDAAGQDPRRPGAEDRRHAAGRLPGLGRDEGGLPLLQQPAGRRRHHPGRAFRRHQGALRRDRGPDPGPARHDRVQLQRDNPEAIGQLSLLKSRHATVTLCGLLMHSSLVLTTAGRPAGPGGRQVLDPQEVQGDQRAEAEGQPDPHPDRAEGERPLAGEPEAVHGAARRAGPLRPRRRPRERHLRAVLRGPGGEDALPGPHVRRSAGRRRRHDDLRGDGTRADPGRPRGRGPRRPGAGLDGRGRPAVLPDDGAPADRQAAEYPPLSLTVIHADERGTPEGREPIRWKLLTDLPVDDLVRDREAGLVRAALEDRDLSQSAEVGLPGRGGRAPHRRAADEPDGGALHHRLAGVLADDDEPGDA